MLFYKNRRDQPLSHNLLCRNRRACLMLEMVWSTFFGVSIMVVYYNLHGLGQLQVFWLQATWSIVATIAAVPCGYLADRFGIRRVIILGSVVQIVQSTLFWQSQTFWQFEIVLVLSGLTIALISGTTTALMTVTINQSIQDEDTRQTLFDSYQRWVTRVRAIGGPIGAIVGSYLATHVGMSSPFALQPLVYLLGLAAAWHLIEPRTAIARQHTAFSAMCKTARILLLEQAKIRWAILLSVLLSVSVIATAWLTQPLLIEAHIPIALFGLIYASRSISTGILAGCAQRLQRRPNTFAWGVQVVVLLMGTIVAATVPGIIGVVTAIASHSFIMACVAPVTTSFLHKQLDDDTNRATELSVISALKTLFFAIIGPFCGWLTDISSVKTAYLAMGMICLVAGGVALYKFHRAMK